MPSYFKKLSHNLTPPNDKLPLQVLASLHLTS
jgi:hypothetical protein